MSGSPGSKIYIARCDFVNGLHLEFNYEDPGRAQAACALMQQAQSERRLVQFTDDAGRQASIDGSTLQAVQLVDLHTETQSIVMLGMTIRAIQQSMDPVARKMAADAQRAPDGNGFEAPPPPVIGGTRFSS